MGLSAGASPAWDVQLGIPSKTPETQRQVRVSGSLGRGAVRTFFGEE